MTLEKDEKMAVISDNGEIKVVEERSFPIMMQNKMEFQLSNAIKTGKCACCGGESLIFFQGNIIAFGCDKRNSVKICRFHDETCPGIQLCQNKEDYDPNYSAFKIKRIREVVDKMFTVFDVVFLEIGNESKEIVADTYLKSKEFIVRTFEIPQDIDDFFIITKSKKNEENKKNLEKIEADRKIDFDKGGGKPRA